VDSMNFLGKNHSNINELWFSRNISIIISKYFYRIQLDYLCPPSKNGILLLLMDMVLTKRSCLAEVTCSQWNMSGNILLLSKAWIWEGKKKQKIQSKRVQPFTIQANVLHSQFVLTCLSVLPAFVQSSVWLRFFFSFFGC
jgi:hypothetical protein